MASSAPEIHTMASIKHICRANVTEKLCKDFIYGALNGFCTDSLFLQALPGNYQLGEQFFKSYPDVKPQQLKLFKRMQRYMGHEMQTLILRGGVVLNNAYDEHGNILAVSMWSLPDSSPLKPKLSVFEQIMIWVKSVYWRVTDSIPFYLAGERPVSLLSDYGVNKWIDGALAQAGAFPSKELTEQLSKKPNSSLENEVYPFTDTYFLDKLCVTVNARRQGLGRKLLEFAEEKFPAGSVTFSSQSNSSTGPSKLCLLSSPAGAALYENAGWTLRFANTNDQYGVRLYDKTLH